ncbi:MAG: hypothetical protein H7333_11935 [Bdellovibrionales bacterium]|nr:hypothetical protein [Oligoflexia bacterium]
MIRTIAGSESPMATPPPRARGVLHSLADIRKAKKLLGLKPSTDLSKRLDELLT